MGGGGFAHGEPTKVDYRLASVRQMAVRAAAGKTLAAVGHYLQVGERGHVVEDAVGKLRDFIAMEGPEGEGRKNVLFLTDGW